MFTTLLFSTIIATCPTTPSQLVTDIGAATQAQVINTSMSSSDPLTCNLDSSMTQTWEGGKLLFSDSPENPTSDGQLFKSTGLSATSGSNYNRLFVYHTNGQGSNKKMVAILKNTSGSTGSFQIQQEGIAGPASNFPEVGAKAYDRWQNATAESAVNVSAGAIVAFDSTFNGKNITSGWLYHGIWDYSFNQTHDVYVCIGITEANCAAASLLSKDSHQRGTCDNHSKTYDYSGTLDTATGVQSFSIAAGTSSNDTDASCVDEASSAFSLSGNFGILYKIHVPYQSTDSKTMGVCVNPRAGAWRGATRSCPSTDSNCGTNQLAGGKFLIPPASTFNSNTQCAVLGKYLPSGTDTYWFQFMPTGGVSFPVRIMQVPY